MLWTVPPLVPVIVTANVPLGVFRLVVTVSTEEVVAGLALNDPLDRVGRLLTLSVTDPVKPLSAVIVTV